MLSLKPSFFKLQTVFFSKTTKRSKDVFFFHPTVAFSRYHTSLLRQNWCRLFKECVFETGFVLCVFKRTGKRERDPFGQCSFVKLLHSWPCLLSHLSCQKEPVAGERGEGPAAEGAAAGGAPQEARRAADQGRKTADCAGGETETKTGEEQSTLGTRTD